MFIEKLSVGELAVNCYIIWDENNETLVIDPGAEGKRIVEFIKSKDLNLKYIINTHGHNDHIAANPTLLKVFDAQLLIHKDDAEFLQNPELNLSFFIGEMGKQLECPEADKLLKEGDILECGKLSLKVIHTPGHTPGGVCLRMGDNLFTGDTLFATGIGRTDFPKGSYSQLRESLDKILLMEDHLTIYPGHGSESTLKRVKAENSYI
ncbi:MBL fold metallo-hydrolase [Halonatronum saccharophilum]|uniref:MBL fold metallo-hydrolase n=1 Tax=Halonatronum saccharophilum TaxID=150060 RepID=UPI000481D40F|nr:MBL fold metallo-hydrolase [Halonatronum saccharophilum]